MTALHGRDGAARPHGRRPRHLLVTAAAVVAAGAALTGHRRAAVVAGAAWLAGTGEFAWARIEPGPRTPAEVLAMVATSVAIPPVAAFHWLSGIAQRRWLLRDVSRAPVPLPPRVPEAVLFDRDGTLVVDVPYNGDPEKVEAMPGAKEALARLRAAGIPTAMISNQSGVARRIITDDQVGAVNERVAELLGPIGPAFVCPHGPDDGCACRKPAPGMVIDAARALGVDPTQVAVIGDIAADVEAARAAGARGVLVPTEVTRPEEIVSADEVAPDISSAVDVLLGGR
jgi:histidinol-phosphate phosphatase family protein